MVRECQKRQKAFDKKKKHEIIKTYMQTSFSPPPKIGNHSLNTLRLRDMEPVGLVGSICKTFLAAQTT